MLHFATLLQTTLMRNFQPTECVLDNFYHYFSGFPPLCQDIWLKILMLKCLYCYYKQKFILAASVNALSLYYNLLMKYDNHQMVWYLLWTRFKASPFSSCFQKWDWTKYTAVPTLKYYQYLPYYFHLVSETHFTKWLLKNAPKFNFCNNLRNYNLHIIIFWGVYV